MKNNTLLTSLISFATAGLINASVGLASTLGDQPTLVSCYQSESCGATESTSDQTTQTDSISTEKSSPQSPERIRIRSTEHFGRR